MITETLFELQDLKFRDFQIKLCPTVSPESIIGVKTPPLRSLAKELMKKDEASSFLRELPHKYFEENQIHAFIISEIKDYDTVIAELERFLPYIDNWATCDQLRPKVFKKNLNQLIPLITNWIADEKTYTIRFGVEMLMQFYLDEHFKPEYLDWVSRIRSEEYYINMMLAWYFATALAKQYDATIPYLTEQRLDAWVHNKTIQKARESYRITPEQKEFLKTLKRQG